MDRKTRASKILGGLKRLYPGAECELDFKDPLQLLVATILSAQCTDVRVNKVTPALFKRYKTAQDLAGARPSELEGLIRSTGFYRNKAANIIGAGKALVEKFGGKVPRTMAELLELPGVARKTANVVLGSAFGLAEGIAVDTHVKRLAYRMDLTDETDPVKVERDLMALVPRKDWTTFHHSMIWHGRRVCEARAPKCPECALNTICPKRGVPAVSGVEP